MTPEMKNATVHWRCPHCGAGQVTTVESAIYKHSSRKCGNCGGWSSIGVWDVLRALMEMEDDRYAAGA